MLIARGEWDVKRMVNVEELPAKPFLALLDRMGLPTRIKDEQGDRALSLDGEIEQPRASQARKTGT